MGSRSASLLWVAVAALACQAFVRAEPRVDSDLFNGRDLEGWTGDMRYWSVSDGQIVGYSADPIPDNQFLWAPVTVRDFHLSFDVKLTPDSGNSGVQFRSERRADGHAFGYQADIGAGSWGRLYEEYGRAHLVRTDRGEKHVKPGEWNHYEVLAAGPRIWSAINGQVSVAYHDPAGRRDGRIAFQLHAGPPMELRIRNLALVHDPPVRIAGLGEEDLNMLLMPRLPEQFRGFEGRFDLRDGDTVVFVGSGNAAKAQDHGHLEAVMTTANAGKRLRFRNMAWQGDTVAEQPRPMNFGDWHTQLDREQASVIVAWFDCMEARFGEGYMKYYLAEYENFLNEAGRHTDRIVIVSPIPFERAGPLMPDLTIHNPMLAGYVAGLRAMASRRGYLFVDLYTPFAAGSGGVPLTGRDGLHLTPDGHRAESLREEVVEKNRLWFDHWRPKNWAFLRGNRTFVEFSRDPAHENRIFPEEIESYRKLIEQADARIAERAAHLAQQRP